MVNSVILYSSIILLFLISTGLFFTTQQKISQLQMAGLQTNSMPMGEKMSRMSFSNFDREMAIKFMDKDGDGKCDACGMPVEMCIDSGQMQCNMDPKSTIGILGSQHIHADWKIYLNGKEFDWSPYADLHEKQMMGDTAVKGTSAFIHIHPAAQPPEKAGDVLHMHATGVPLWIFFKSLDIELPGNIKAYVNGKEIPDWKNYVFKDLDKLLITDAIGNLQERLDSITDFAKNH